MTFKKYLLLLLCLPCFVQAKNITISRLTCEMQEGLVVVESCPRLGWAMESPENGTRQTAYEIEIREAFTGRSVWNSGKVTSSQSQLVPTEGADICLNNPFNYSWRVRVWDETDTPSEWSQESKREINWQEKQSENGTKLHLFHFQQPSTLHFSHHRSNLIP